MTSRRLYKVQAAAAAAMLVCCSCQQPGGAAGVGVRTYSDSVVHINQVDPAYRAYFQDQNSANYSLSDQRKAYIAAAETARTPVRASDYRPSDVRKRAVANASKKGAKGKTRVAAKKPSAKKTAVARKSPKKG